MKAVRLIIKGRVQGVGYRRWFEKEAIQLNLKGYVRNLATGEVEATLVGEPQTILTMIHHSYVGPLHAQVESIEHIQVDIKSAFDGFKMLRD